MTNPKRFHAAVAVVIAAAFPSTVWAVNGFLPVEALVLGAALGLAYWTW